MWAFRVVDHEVGVQVGLHLGHRLVELLAALDSEVLVQERAVQSLDEAVALRPANLGGPVLDLFELQEQHVWVLIGPPAVLTAVVRQDGRDRGAVLVEERQHRVVEGLDRRQGDLAGVQLARGVVAVGIQSRRAARETRGRTVVLANAAVDLVQLPSLCLLGK